jgi:hypothetical protein
MLYKRGTGTRTDPYNVTYRWNVIPEVSIGAGANTITLRFPQGISNNGAWPGPEAWKIFDGNGTTYTVTGTSGMGEKMTLTVLPAIPQNAKNTSLTLRYSQQFDDASQGLNNTKGAILRASNPPLLHFGLSDATLEIEVTDDGGDEDGSDDDKDDEGGGDQDGECDCEKNAGVCLCSSAAGSCGCAHAGLPQSQLKILSDNVHYLVLGKPFILDLEAEGGTTPYVWSMEDKEDNGLPQGLTFSEEGIVEGTPEAPGSFRVAIQASDSEEKTTSKRFTFLVVEDENLTVMTDTLPDAQVGMFYAARVRGSGGTKPYIWALENIPSWLSFDPNSGILSGTPTEPAIYNLTAQVQDGEENTDSKLLRLSVYPHNICSFISGFDDSLHDF